MYPLTSLHESSAVLSAANTHGHVCDHRKGRTRGRKARQRHDKTIVIMCSEDTNCSERHWSPRINSPTPCMCTVTDSIDHTFSNLSLKAGKPSLLPLAITCHGNSEGKPNCLEMQAHVCNELKKEVHYVGACKRCQAARTVNLSGHRKHAWMCSSCSPGISRASPSRNIKIVSSGWRAPIMPAMSARGGVHVRDWRWKN